MFHLGWFLGSGFGIQPWAGEPWAGTNGWDWMQPGFYVDMATSLERAGFDYILIEDTTSIDDTFGGTMESTLNLGQMAPKSDPLPLVPLLTGATKHIGIAPTISTSFYHPYLAARLMTTLDHLTEGRVGINVVTSVNHRAAQNFGFDRHFDHDLRYEMAHEWLDVVSQLWESWEPDAIKIDQENNVYADFTKVHPIDFEGRFYKSRGPLNTVPGPQRRPVVVQAGTSAPGRTLAAKHADTMIGQASTIEGMKEFREDIRSQLVAAGRKPDDCKVLFLMAPVVGRTDEEARERDRVQQEAASSPLAIERALWHMSYVSGGEVDFKSFDLDAPMPEVIGNGEQSIMARYVEIGGGRKTLREVASQPRRRTLDQGIDFVGSPDTVAAQMGEVMEEVGGDGFLLSPTATRVSVNEIADGLAPALRRRGLIRSGYTFDTFRENLLEF
jgi:FMN-dependent oxidoreductase (nitrilotriacetate monooxygenase family)